MTMISFAEVITVPTPGASATTETGKTIETAITAAGPVFGFIQTIFVFIGIVIILVTLFKVIKAFAGAKFPDAVKFGLGGLVAAALCFNLWIPIGIVNNLGGLVTNLFTTVGEAMPDATPTPKST